MEACEQLFSFWEYLQACDKNSQKDSEWAGLTKNDMKFAVLELSLS